MKVKANEQADDEVLGIVILRGKSERVEPKLTLYMWCDEPGTDVDSTTKAA